MKSIISKKNLVLTGMIMITAFFGAMSVIPSTAKAGYDGYNGGSYNHFRPITIAQMYPESQVYAYPVPQPVPVIQQVQVPTPVYYPVYQQQYQTQSYPVYQQYQQYPQYQQYQNLQVSCYSNVASSYTGSQVTWSASASGGTGSYNYSWSGTDGLYGYSSSVSKLYYSNGYKYGSVTVTSGNQTITQNCTNSVQISDSYYQGYNQQAYSYPTQYVTYNNNTQNTLDIGCYADPMTSTVNQPITWSAEVTGGIAPYTYSWSGSDSLSGSQSSVTKYYSSSGQKSAIVSVTSADGKTGTHACSNQLAVRNVSSSLAYASTPTSPTTQTQSQTNQSGTTQTQSQNNSGSQAQSSQTTTTAQASATPAPQAQTAAAIFSLGNVPWGWVAILIILVLFGTVLYMLFNRQKI